MFRGNASCPDCGSPNPVVGSHRHGSTVCLCCQAYFQWQAVNERRNGALVPVVRAKPLTPAERLARLQDRCSPGCKGWAIFNEYHDRHAGCPVGDPRAELQACDDCWADQAEPLTDTELLHIAGLARAIHKFVKPTTPDAGAPLTEYEIGIELLRENLRSLGARYPRDDHGAPERHRGFVEIALSGPVVYKSFAPDPVKLLKSIACYCYQACETDDFDESRAAQWLDSLKAATIERLPGYDAAPWGAPF